MTRRRRLAAVAAALIVLLFGAAVPAGAEEPTGDMPYRCVWIPPWYDPAQVGVCVFVDMLGYYVGAQYCLSAENCDGNSAQIGVCKPDENHPGPWICPQPL